MSSEARLAKSPREHMKERARGQLSMLIAQFLVGLAVSHIGMPSETSGAARIASIVLLSLHVLISVGLIVGAILSVRIAAHIDSPEGGLAWGGAAAMVVIIAAGVLTLLTKSEWWAYLMGAGAALSLPPYGLLYLRSIT